MDKSTDERRGTDNQIVTAPTTRRRLFLKSLGGGVLGATAVAAGIGGAERAEAKDVPRLWKSADVLIGNSPADQSPGPFIECPLFFDDGHFADATHILDLSNLYTTGTVIGTITHRNDTIDPDFGASIAVAVALGTDNINYLLVAGEGTVTGATGFFRGVTKAIIRCKYKLASPQPTDLVACVDCVIILVSK